MTFSLIPGVESLQKPPQFELWYASVMKIVPFAYTERIH